MEQDLSARYLEETKDLDIDGLSCWGILSHRTGHRGRYTEGTKELDTESLLVLGYLIALSKT